MFLDDDDLLFSDHIETIMSVLLRDDELSAAYALSIEVKTEVNKEKTSYIEKDFNTPALFKQIWDYRVMEDHNFIPIQAIIFKKELYELNGGFDTELEQLEDWNLWLRYGFDQKFSYIPKTTSLFRTPASIKEREKRHGELGYAYNYAKLKAQRSILAIST